MGTFAVQLGNTIIIILKSKTKNLFVLLLRVNRADGTTGTPVIFGFLAFTQCLHEHGVPPRSARRGVPVGVPVAGRPPLPQSLSGSGSSNVAERSSNAGTSKKHAFSSILIEKQRLVRADI